jgi:predicted amidophosphoribosyltransferase
MYCSSCGAAVPQNLSYCNHCGSSLNRAHVDKSSEVKPGILVPAMVFLFVFGLLAIALLTGMMKTQLLFNEGAILGFTLLSFLILLGLEGVFVSLLFRRRRHDDETETVKLKGRATNELDANQAPALLEGMPSVTEHTTRTFDPVYNERK